MCIQHKFYTTNMTTIDQAPSAHTYMMLYNSFNKDALLLAIMNKHSYLLLSSSEAEEHLIYLYVFTFSAYT